MSFTVLNMVVEELWSILHCSIASAPNRIIKNPNIILQIRNGVHWNSNRVLLRAQMGASRTLNDPLEPKQDPFGSSRTQIGSSITLVKSSRTQTGNLQNPLGYSGTLMGSCETQMTISRAQVGVEEAKRHPLLRKWGFLELRALYNPDRILYKQI